MAMAMVDDNNDVNGDSTTGNKVGNDGDSAMGNDNDNGDHDGGDGAMGSSATGYDDDGDDDGDGQDDNYTTTTMATAQQVRYYAHLILNWKKMFDTMATGDDDNDQR